MVLLFLAFCPWFAISKYLLSVIYFFIEVQSLVKNNASDKYSKNKVTKDLSQ